MQQLKEISRRSSPGGRPQPIAVLGSTLWVGAWDTNTVYGIDPQSWTVTAEFVAPGRPYGMAPIGAELRVVISLGEDDDRYLYRFAPGSGFDETSKIACPEFTGSHLAANGKELYLCQQGKRRILALASDGSVTREIALPTRCGGFAFGGGACYMISADEEWDAQEVATIDLSANDPKAVPVAGMPFEGRGLAFGGDVWWTNNRDASEIISFTV